ncbi:MAG: DUF1559 domain-containing protein, partial [Planctomycetota bacterium]
KRISLFGDLGWPSGTRATLRNSSTPDEPTDTYTNPDCYYTSIDTPDWEDRIFGKVPKTFRLPDDPALYVGGFSSAHTTGVNFLMCDGSVKTINRYVDRNLFRTLGHRADGAPLEVPGSSLAPRAAR